MKQICPIHRFSYNGDKCPFCEKERIDRLAQKYVMVEHTKPKETKKTESEEITEESLNKLMEKFNVKKK